MMRRRQHRRPYGLLLVAVVVAGCTTPSLTTDESAIRGGAVDDGDPAVASLNILGISLCTATLIAPHTVLTAGHCNHIGQDASFGTQAASPSQSIAIASVAVHPMFTGAGKPYDFALMKLASDPVGIAPVRLNATALTPADVGRNIRHVGFGVTDDSTHLGGGTKRTVSYSLNRVDGILIYSGAQGEQTCGGDSGGPGFVKLGAPTETLVGIVSDGPNCDLSQDGWDDRVDLVKDWIVQTVSAWDAPPGFGGDPGGAIGDARVPPDEVEGRNDPSGSTGSPATGCAAGEAVPGPLCGLVCLLLLCTRARRVQSIRGR